MKPDNTNFIADETLQPAFELTLVKAVIVAAKADGHIDEIEQQRIFKAAEQMDITTEMKGRVFDLLRQQISMEELTKGINAIEQMSEIYLASCIAITPDHTSEQAHLDQLASALELPEDLANELQ